MMYSPGLMMLVKTPVMDFVVGDDGKFRTRAYFVTMQFVRGVSTGSLLVY